MKNEVREFKRDKILDEAISLFAKNGYRGTSIDLISKQLEVSKPFIYTYFKNKSAILEEIFVRAAENMLTVANNVLSLDLPPVERLKKFSIYYVLENIHHADITTIFLNEEKNLPAASRKRLRAKHRSFDSKLAEMIDEGIRSGVFMVEDSMLASLAISGMVRWVHRWYRNDGRLTPEEAAEQISRLVLKVVSPSAPVSAESPAIS